MHITDIQDTQPVLKSITKASQSSDVLPVKIKDEPMDEEYETASTPHRPIGSIKDEPDTSAVSFHGEFCLFN